MCDILNYINAVIGYWFLLLLSKENININQNPRAFLWNKTRSLFILRSFLCKSNSVVFCIELKKKDC
jgi:hypothetical protein